MEKINNIRPFKYWCQKVLPLVYDDSLSYYELLCKVMNALNISINNINILEENINTLDSELLDLKEYVNNYFNNLNIQDEIDNKIDSMVEDGSFTQMLKNYLPFITLSMFDAHEDGITDDSDSLQSALNLSSETDIAVYLKSDIAIGKTVTIPSNAKLYSFNTNISPTVKVLSGVTNAFTSNGTNICISGIRISPETNTYSEITALQFNNINSDVIIKNVTISYCNTAISVSSRNVRIFDCLISHCKTGIFFDLSVDSQYRGLSVENNRFHGIGAELAIGWFEDSSAIKFSGNNTGNVTIRNNTCEQGGTFISGYMSNMLIENNMCECYAKPIIDIGSDTPVTPVNTGVIEIIGNFFTGKKGQVTQSYTANYPDNIIKIRNVYRVQIINNVVKFSSKHLLNIENSNTTQINGNIFNSSNLDNTIKSVMLIKTSTISVENNNDIGNTQMFDSKSSGTVFNYVGNYLPIGETSMIVSASDTWVLLESVSNGSTFTTSMPKEFLINVSGQNIGFKCTRNGNYYSGGSYLVDDTHLMTLSFDISNGVVPNISVFELPAFTKTSPAYTLDVYMKVQ